MLTLIPLSWSRKKVSETFKVSEYLVRQSHSVLKQKGILSFPEPRKGKILADEVIQKILIFYTDDEFSKIMPGQKK